MFQLRCNVIVFGFWMIVTSYSLVNGELSVKIGALFETNTDAERRALRLATQQVNSDGNLLSPYILVNHLLRNVTKGDVYMSTKSVCDIAKIGVVALVTMTSCSVETSIQSIGDSLNLPVLQIGSKYCGSPRLSGNYFFTSRPEEEIILQALTQYIYSNRLRSMVICYEQGTDTTTIQRLLTSLSKNQRHEVTTKLMDIPASIEKDKDDNSAVTDTFKNLSKKQGDKKVDAFIVFASASVTVQFIAKVHRSNPGTSSGQRWVIANPGIRKQHMREIERATQSRVVVIKHKINQNNPLVQKFISAWNNDLAIECPTCMIPNVEAGDIPMTAFYIYDGIIHLSRALTAMLNDNWKSPTSLECRTLTVTPWSGGRNLMDKIRTLNSSGLLGTMSLNSKGYQTTAVFEIYDKLPGAGETFIKLYDWKSGSPNKTKGTTSMLPNIANTNRTFRVATLEEPPFVFIDETPTGEFIYSGFSIDLLQALAKKNNFEYELYRVKDNKYGIQKSDGSWNGLIGDVVRGEADLAIAAMTITAQREKVVDFTKRYMDYSVGIVMKKPRESSSLFSFVYPFHTSVWFCILSSLILVSVVIFVLTRVSPLRPPPEPRDDDDTKITVVNCFWFAYSSLMQQGSELHTITWPIRVVTGFWWFFALIVVSSYTANLAAFLTVTRMETPIRNFDDLANQKQVDYGTVVDTSIFDHIMTKGEKALDEQSVYKKMSKAINATTNRITEAKIGFKKAETGKFAFLWDVAVIQYEILNHKSCSLTTVPDSIYDKGYGIALEHGSPFRDLLSLGILDLQESGEITKLTAKWWPKTGTCTLGPSDASSRGTELTLENFAGVFYVLAAGLFIACTVAGMEIIFHIKKGKPYPPVRDGKASTDGMVKEQLPRVPSVESQSRANEEDILVVLKKKDVMRYLAESEIHKRSSAVSENNIPRATQGSLPEENHRGINSRNESSVMGALCCHKADVSQQKKSPLDDERAVLSSHQLQRVHSERQSVRHNTDIPTTPDKGQTGTLVKSQDYKRLTMQPSMETSLLRNRHSNYGIVKQSMPDLTSQYFTNTTLFPQRPFPAQNLPRHNGSMIALATNPSQNFPPIQCSNLTLPGNRPAAPFSAVALKRRLLLHKAATESIVTSPTSSMGGAISDDHLASDDVKLGYAMTSYGSKTLPHCRPETSFGRASELSERNYNTMTSPRPNMTSQTMEMTLQRPSVTSQRNHPKCRRQHSIGPGVLYSSSSQDRTTTDAEDGLDIATSPHSVVFNHKKQPIPGNSRIFHKNSCV
uniref:glutamate receptor ionotropic, delta-1-like isoform X1 n=1 Tax=Styela clava TaxID=7725 RepID=UPI0019399F75|nr:glutamate receptor ionotropic, delta-1-like isoform X1 [Styela clava]